MPRKQSTSADDKPKPDLTENVEDALATIKQMGNSLKTLMKKRRRVQMRLLELQEQHSEVFDELEDIRASTLEVENEIKDLVRKQYVDGAPRGIFRLYEDDMFYVKATVKYGKDTVDMDRYEEWAEKESSKSHNDDIFHVMDEAIAIEKTIDINKLRELVDNGKMPRSVLRLAEPGKFHTPSVTIKNKLDSSIVEE